MNARVVAAAEIGSFIALDDAGSYAVLTLTGAGDLEIGDVLSGHFDGRGPLFYAVRNLTKLEDVRICLDNWDCGLPVAIDALLRLIHSPCWITAGGKRLVSDSHDIADQLYDAIRPP